METTVTAAEAKRMQGRIAWTTQEVKDDLLATDSAGIDAAHTEVRSGKPKEAFAVQEDLAEPLQTSVPSCAVNASSSGL